jgi:hypothetical protein
MVEEVLTKRGILMRGLAHPGLFQKADDGADDADRPPGGEGGEGGEGRGQQQQRAAAPGGSARTGTGTGTGTGTSSASGNGNSNMQQPAFMGNTFQSFGAVRVTPTAMYRLLAAGEARAEAPGRSRVYDRCTMDVTTRCSN